LVAGNFSFQKPCVLQRVSGAHSGTYLMGQRMIDLVLVPIVVTVCVVAILIAAKSAGRRRDATDKSPTDDHLLPERERPSWLNYPTELVEMVTSGRLHLVTWRISEVASVRDAMFRHQWYLRRDLVTFAHRIPSEDVACFEKGKGQQVVIIHENTTRGWEDEGSYPSFSAWLTAVEAEAEDY
jgi:hypothetical protein